MLRARALTTLWRGTRAEHAAIERAVPILGPRLTLAVYRAHLARLLGIYAPLEVALAEQRWDVAGLDFAARRKTPLLALDLDRLGLASGARAALPRCAALPELAALPEAFGCAYVLEGATRGGRVLAGRVEAALGLDRAHGCAFLLAYGDDADRMWEAFTAALEAALGDEAELVRALGAARQTFAILQRWIEGGA
jgi:heme oxygenase